MPFVKPVGVENLYCIHLRLKFSGEVLHYWTLLSTEDLGGIMTEFRDHYSDH